MEMTSTMFQSQSYPSPTNPASSPPTTFISPQEMSQDSFSESTPSVVDALDNNESTSGSSKKKRKSWGQVLPLPTTNLPPRKRAKTEAEKEQRRYERVQRNRAAAHASRMRKQEETDNLRAENNRLQQDNQELRQTIQRLQEALSKGSSFAGYEKLLTPPRELEPPVESVPSLSSGSPHSSPTSSLVHTPPPAGDNDMPLFTAITPDATHSAAMCDSQQWTSDVKASTSKRRKPPARTKAKSR